MIKIIVYIVILVGIILFLKKKKSDSIYDNDLSQKNPFEGKKVIFVKSNKDKENADGVRGHLKEIGITSHTPTNYEKYLKRIIDVLLSFIGLVVLSPVFLIIAIIIKVEDPGPVLFTQKRIGQNKQYFKLHKFRSMKMSTPHDVPTHMLSNPDAYITRIGKFIRSHSLDELPQIWDIFIGNMTIIGPRPALWNQDVLTSLRDEYDANDIKPGLTGLAQINGRDELDLNTKAKLDGDYAKNLSFKLDLEIFLKTIHVFKGDKNIVEGNGKTKTIKKRILVICQYYKPEPFRISDICEELVRRGNEVHVVTGYPNYPEGEIYKGYGIGKHIDEVINCVKVHRSYTYPRKTGSINRVLNYYSYAFSSIKYINSKKCVASDGRPFDVVLVNQLSPVMMAKAAISYKKKYDVPIVMYCLDLWPESLLVGGIKKGSFIYKHYHKVSEDIYKQMDKILVSSEGFISYFKEEFGIKKYLSYLPQYCEDNFKKDTKKKKDKTYHLMFAGNIGSAQSIDTIIKAAALLKDEPIKFEIVGGGSELDNLKKMAKGMKNVSFLGRKKASEMPTLYSKADAMLITLKDNPSLSLTLPGKVQSYMAAGKPIIGAIDGATNDVIKKAKCGYCGNAEDEKMLVRNIKKFIESNNKEELGNNAYKYYQKHFSKKHFLDELEMELTV